MAIAFRAFVAMPFAQQFYSIFLTIRQAVEKLGGTAFRIDEVWAREDIYKQIEQEIITADIVIADFTGDRVVDIPNPNVVHEATFAHVHKKYLVLLAQDYKCLPFDWRTRPAILYQQNDEGLKYLGDRMLTAIQAIIQRPDFRSESSVEKMPIPNTMPFSTPNVYFPNMNATNFQNPNMLANIPSNYTPINSSNYSSFSLRPTTQSINRAEYLQSLLKNFEFSLPEGKPLLPPGFHYAEDNPSEENLLKSPNQDRIIKVICEEDESSMVLIPSVSFCMGGNEDDDQKPVHEVSLSAYLIDIMPVSNKQFQKFIAVGGYNNPEYWTQEGWIWKTQNNIQLPAYINDNRYSKPNQPVVGVSWYEAMAYSAWANKHLPTEAQWECAARGTDQRIYPWGNDKPTRHHANFQGGSEKPSDCSKYSRGISAYSCYDMAGNVWEWCFDWYDENYYKQQIEQQSCSQIHPNQQIYLQSQYPEAQQQVKCFEWKNPCGPNILHAPKLGQELQKVCRGGSWNYGKDVLKTYYRFWGPIALRDVAYGFRCSRILEITPTT